MTPLQQELYDAIQAKETQRALEIIKSNPIKDIDFLPDATNPHSAVNFALIQRMKTVAIELIENEANINAKSNDEAGWTPLFRATFYTALHTAPLPRPFESYEDVVLKLIEHGVELNTLNGQNADTALHNVTTLPVVQVFIAKGADINIKNKENETPLDNAGAPCGVKLALLAAGATTQCASTISSILRSSDELHAVHKQALYSMIKEKGNIWNFIKGLKGCAGYIYGSKTENDIKELFENGPYSIDPAIAPPKNDNAPAAEDSVTSMDMLRALSDLMLYPLGDLGPESDQ